MLTSLGDGLALLTLQPADRSWETWIVLLLAWALTTWAVQQSRAHRIASIVYPTMGLNTVGLAH